MKNSTSRLGKWTRIVESDKVKVKEGMGHKVVLTPKDSRTLQIKIVNDADVLTADQKLTPSGFTAIVNFIKQQPAIINDYPALNDLTTNLVVYTVSKDTERKQLITFTIGSKAEIGGINSQVKYVRQDELELAKTGAILNTGETAAISASTSTATFTVPVESSKIKDSTDSKLITWMKETYRKIMKDPIAAANPIMAKVKKELGANKLGNDSQVFVMGLNGGYGIFDWSGEDLETGITQKLLDKVAMTPAVLESSLFLGLNGQRLVEELSTTVVGFDPDKFNGEITRAQAEAELDTGGIKVPAEGFKYGLRGDAEFKKFQDILVKYLPTYSSGALAAVGHVKNFVAAVPMVGDYGDKTKALIQFLKAGLVDPKYPDNDSLTIKSDFVNRMLKEFGQVTESHSYISLDGSSLINEGFDVAAGTAVAGTGTVAVKKKKNKSKGGGGGSSSTAKASDIYHIQGKEDWEYTVVGKIPHTRKVGTSAWVFLNNSTSIKKIIKKVTAAKGNGYAYFPLWDKTTGKRLDKNLYTYNKGWLVWLDGAWEAVEGANLTKLINLYGKDPSASGGTTATAAATSNYASIDKKIKNTVARLTNLFSDVGKREYFSEFKSYNPFYGGDDEAGAVKKFKIWWEDMILPLHTEIKKDVALVKDEAIKRRYNRSLTTIWDWGKSDADDSLIDTLYGGNDSDWYKFTIYYSDYEKTEGFSCDI
jgi:hypothetical protein